METIIEEKNNQIIHDVIHGEIILDELAKKIVETKEFRRLKGITQTGTSKYVFPNLEKSDRFDHSIGAYHIMSLIIDRFEKCLKPFDVMISPYHKKMAKTAMLLHDIGHGPLSHTFERIIGYSHEQVTVNIIKNEDTEIHKVLMEKFSNEEIDSLISFIDYESNSVTLDCYSKKDNIIDVLKLLVSNQIDADRLDYLIRDAYFAGYKSSIDINEIINGLNITIDNDRWLLIGNQNCLSQFETVLFERLRNYRDIYYHPVSLLADDIILNAINLVRDNEEMLKLLKKEIRDMIEKKDTLSLDSFLELNDKSIEDTLHKISQMADNKLLSYACNIKKNLTNYIPITPGKNINSIIRRLRLIFNDVPNVNNFDFLDKGIIIDINKPFKAYKSNNREGIFIYKNGKITDIDQCSCFINKHPNNIEVCSINPDYLKLYFDIDELTYEQKYLPKLIKLMEWLNYPEKEFELKYVKKPDQELDCSKVIQLLKNNGFKIGKENDIINTDYYYDTKNLDYFKSKSSMRIRQINSFNVDDLEYEVTLKTPTGEKAKFSTRDEHSDVLTDYNIEEAKQTLQEKGIYVKDILPFPILKVINNRHIIELVKNGILVELAFDNVKYENLINEMVAYEQMIEAEPKLSNGISDRIILNEIYDIFEVSLKEVRPDDNPSKYYTGLKMTGLTMDDLDKAKPLVKVR